MNSSRGPKSQNRRARSVTDLQRMKRMGARIRMARDAAGMTQGDVAPLLGFQHNSAVSEVELGRMVINPLDLLKLSQVLNRPILYFYGEDVRPRSLADWQAISDGDDAWAQAHFALDQKAD